MTAQDAPPRLPACTLLIVDDSPEDRAVYRDYLARSPRYALTILEAGDVDDAMRICRGVRVDCILLDFGLPDESGLEFMQRLRQEPFGAHVAVVMVTGRGSEMIAVECLKSGAADYLMKAGLDPALLAQALHHAVERSRMQEHLREEQRDREETEAELRESEARFRLLVDSVRDYAIFVLDRDGAVSSWNAGARLLLGYHDTEIIGQPFRQLLTQEDVRARLAERLLDVSGSDTAPGCEGWVVRRDGCRVWMARNVTPVVDRFGVHRGYSVVMRDTVERRQAAQQLALALRAHHAYAAAVARDALAPLQRAGAVTGRARDAELAEATAALALLIDPEEGRAACMPYFPQQGDLVTVVRGCVHDLRDNAAAAAVAGAQIEAPAPVDGMWDADWIGRALASLTRGIGASAHQAATVIAVHGGGDTAHIELRVGSASPPVAPPATIPGEAPVPPDAAGAAAAQHRRRGRLIGQFLVEAMGGVLAEGSTLDGGTTYHIRLPVGGGERARGDA